VAANVPAELVGRIADLRALIAAPDIVLVADRTGYPVGRVAATYFAVAALFGVHRLTAAEIAAADYFDRLALDRARDAIGDAERKLTAAILAEGAWGSEAVAAWSAKRKAEVERVKLAIGEMVASGLTVSKLAVAASMLDDLARGRGVELLPA
jgi:glutamate dehydrogenase